MVTIDVPQLAYAIQMTDPFFFLTTVNARFSPIVLQPTVEDDGDVMFFQLSTDLSLDLTYMLDIQKNLFPDLNSDVKVSELWRSVILHHLEERSSLPILILSEYMQNSNPGWKLVKPTTRVDEIHRYMILFWN